MDKKTAKKMLICTLSLFFGTLIISTALVFSITLAGVSNLALSNAQLFFLCIGTAVIPTGSFVGFFTTFSRIKEVTKPLIFALCVIFPITLTAITLYGIAAIIPTIIKCIKIIS